MQCRWNRQCAERPVKAVFVDALSQHARLKHRLGHLLYEEGHAVGLRGDLLEQWLGQAFAAGDTVDDRQGRFAAKPVQCQPGDDWMTTERCGESRASGDQYENTSARNSIERGLNQLQGRRV